jgi:chromosome segregation protein
MYLSRLEILGFKSFPQKTELIFDDNLTAIVGPNGCGKTNILDAIRWVLGEQRTSLLRSNKMEEVIFNGTKDLKPLGLAEVSMIIENNKGILPIDYDQVVVSRRLFRSGESEYLLNKVPCRLKDITELFLDTGMGTHAYSVIQPEMVEAILSDRAEERRFLFEEAAGITKYKLRKKEAERKLEYTENDLLRLSDILSEVEKQTNSLRRQKAKAERFKRLTDQIKSLEVHISQNEFESLKIKERELEKKVQEFVDEGQKVKSDLDKEEAEIESLKLELLDKEKELSAMQKKIGDFSEASFRLEREISVSQERKTHLEEFVYKTKKEEESLSQRLFSIKKEKGEKKEELKELTSEIKTKEQLCQKEEEELLANDEKLREIKNEFEGFGKDLKEQEEALNKNKNEHENIKTQVEELKERDRIFAEEKGAILQRLSEISAEVEDLTLAYQEKKKTWEGKKEEKNHLEEKIKVNQITLDQLSSEEAKTKSLLSAEEAKLGMLRQISEHYEGYGKGQKAVLLERERLKGIIDTVANLITTQKEYLKAIESALGESLQFVVCRYVGSALEAIRYLKENQNGGATFLPLDKIENINLGQKKVDLQDFEGTVGWASDLVHYKEEFRKIVGLFLGNVILIKTLEDCLKISQKIPAGFHLVSLDGEVISSKGSISGGSPKEISILGRELEMQRIKDQFTKLKEKRDQLQREKKIKEDENLVLKDQLSQISVEAEKLTSDFQQKEFKLKTSEFEKTNLEKRSKELKELKEQIINKVSELSQKQKSLSQSIEDFENQKEKLGSQINEKGKILEETENLHNHIFQRINQLKIELVSFQGKEEQLTNDDLRLTELISEMELSFATKEREIKESLAETEEINKSILEKREELKNAFEEIEQQKKSLNSLQEDQAERQMKLNNKERDLKLFRGAKEKVQDEFHQLEMEKLELSSRAESIKERIWEEYKVDLLERASVGLEKPESKDQSPTEDLEGTKEKLDSLKEKVKTVGPVNLLALEEYQSSKQRLEFLKNQMHDLTEAKQTLNCTILKINQTARALFQETLEKIKANFQKVFEQLFEGGEADLTLVEEGDPLESPVQISARPYGKRLLNISQLSGGEKALTAIALLFAIYLVKPSPFCILDEVDAPLDDANIVRFLKLIRHFSSNTQFIIITHNKLTMEAANVLYGVTMEQPGVSRIVSVRFNKQEVVV